MKLAIVTAHRGAESLVRAVRSWGHEDFQPECGLYDAALFQNPQTLIVNGDAGMLPAYQGGFERMSHADILAFFHDDLILNDPDWQSRVLKEFEDPSVGLVGFGGGTGHGTPRIYKDLYDYRQLARSNFMSNMVDAEAHGMRFTGARDVAVLDGFALIVRREILTQACWTQDGNGPIVDTQLNGWPLNTPIGYACYDYWLCCMVRRLGYRIRLVGVACNHLGGQTFVKLGIGKDPKYWDEYLAAHEYIYSEFRDCLPYSVE